MSRLDPAAEARVLAGARFAARFFTGQSEVHQALERLIAELNAAGIPYAIVGALALNEYGYRRVTEDVAVLLTRAGLDALKGRVLGHGYVEKFPGSKGLRDTINAVNVDVLLTGDYPGDGRPKPVRFPDPEIAAVRGDKMALLPLERLIELKLASGMSAPHRLRDLADVLELVRLQGLPESFGEQLDPYVRARFHQLWQAARTSDPE